MSIDTFLFHLSRAWHGFPFVPAGHSPELHEQATDPASAHRARSYRVSKGGLPGYRHEFAGNSNTTFVATGGGGNVGVNTTRVGTFGQVSGGVALQGLNVPIIAFVRGDVRFGSNLHGWAATGGVRYTF